MGCAFKLTLNENETYVFSSNEELNTFIEKNYNRLKNITDGLTKLTDTIRDSEDQIRKQMKLIKKNKAGEILAPNGKPSFLYKKLEAKYGPVIGLALYAKTKTSYFGKFYGADNDSYTPIKDNVSISKKYGHVEEVGTIGDLLNLITNKDNTISDFISMLDIDSNIKVFSVIGNIVVNGKMANGYYDDDKNVLMINRAMTGNIDTMNLLHEIIHAATVSKVKRSLYSDDATHVTAENKELVDKLNKISTTIRNYLTANKDLISEKYGIKSPDLVKYFRVTDDLEMIAQIFSNKTFIDILKDIPAVNIKKHKSLWEEVLDFFSNLFGIDIRGSIVEDAIGFLKDCKEAKTLHRPLLDSNNEPVLIDDMAVENYLNDYLSIKDSFDPSGSFNDDNYQIIKLDRQQERSPYLQEVVGNKEKLGEYDPQSEIISKLNSIKRDNEAFAKTSYNKTTGEKEVAVGTRLTHEGYIGVNRKIDNYRTPEGARIVAQFISDNYVKFFVNQELEKIKATSGLEGKSEEKLIEELKKQALQNIENWSVLADLGTDIHKVAELFFGEGIESVEEIKKRAPLAHTDDILLVTLNALKSFKETLEKNYGPLKYVTELKIHHPASKTVGIIDLIAVDKNGKAHIFDFKASYKDSEEWNHNKIVKIGYQLAAYKRMLYGKGINVASADILPIKLHNIDYNTKSIGMVEAEPIIPYSGIVVGKKFSDVAKELIPLNGIQFSEDYNVSSSIKEQLKKNFGYEINAKATYSSIKSFRDKRTHLDEETKKWYFTDDTLPGKTAMDRRVYLPNDEESANTIILNYLAKKASKDADSVAAIRDQLNKVINGTVLSIEKLFRSYEHKQMNKFRAVFNRYVDGTWEIVEDEQADALGILMFKHMLSDTIEFVSLTGNPINKNIKLNGGNTTILGNYLPDSKVTKDVKIMKATNGNLELMKVATFINAHVDDFNNSGVKIGQIKVVNMDFGGGASADFNLIKYNYEKLCVQNGTKSQLNKVGVANKIDILIARIDTLLDDANYKDKTTLTAMQSALNEADNATVLATLSNLFKEIYSRVKYKKDTFDFETEDEVMLAYISQAILYVKGINTTFEQDILNWSFNNSKYLSSPSAFQHTMIRESNRIIQSAMQSIRSEFVKYKQENRNVITKFFRDTGYTAPREYLVGDNVSAYLHLFETDGKGGLHPQFRLKNPDDRHADLTDAERNYIRYFLDKINSVRYVDPFAKEEAISTGEYFNVPILRGSTLSKLKNNSYSQVIKDEFWENYYNINNFFDEDDNALKERSEFLVEMFNQFKWQNDPDARAKMLEERGKDNFECDLEVVLDTFMMANIREKQYNKILPTLSAIRVNLNYVANGILEESPNALSYMKEYSKTAIFNDKMIESGTAQAAEKISQLIRSTTTKLTLRLNVVSGLREAMQGHFNNISKMMAKFYGEDQFSKEHFAKAMNIMLADGPGFMTNITTVEELNHLYGISGMDINMIVQRMASNKKGLMAFKSRWAFWQNSAPDYFHRMTLFIAQMIKDGCYEAHTIENGIMKYNWKLDKRFSLVVSGDKSNPEYAKQYGLLKRMQQEFNADGYRKEDGSSYSDIEDGIPECYTARDRSSLKMFSDLIHGYYDHESKILLNNMVLGTMFLHFKQWLAAKKDQYVLKPGEYAIGGWKQVLDPEGNPLYLDNDGNPTLTPTGQALYDWKGRYMEGIFHTLIAIGKDVYNNKFDMAAVIEGLKERPERIANLKLICYDTTIYFLISILLAGLIKGGPDDDDLVYRKTLSNTVYNSASDMSVINNIATILTPNSWIASITILSKAFKDTGTLLTGDMELGNYLTRNIGMARSINMVIPSSEE